MEDTRFLTEDEITIVCINSRKLETFKFSHIGKGDFRIYNCQCGCGGIRIFPVSLPDNRYEDGGRNLIEVTNIIAMGTYDY